MNFVSSKVFDKTLMPTRSDDIEIMMGNETDEITAERFKSLLQRCQKDLEKNERSWICFGSVDLLHCNLSKIRLNRNGSNINSPECLKNKKATINPKNNPDNAFSMLL